MVAVTALVLVLCLQASPSSCVEQRPWGDMSPMECVLRGQVYAADWLADHPKWRFARWRCEVDVPRQEGS